MLEDPELRKAVSKIVQRSERQEDLRRLVGTYVDVGLLPQLSNVNHQVLYGRRGTGKTHVLKVLQSEYRKDPRQVAVYIDCRTLGSTSQFSDHELPMKTRCLALFRDVLLAIYHDLIEHIIESPSSRGEDALKEADQLKLLITEPVRALEPEKMSEVKGTSGSETARISAALGPKAGLGISAGTASRNEQSQTTEFSA